MNSANRRQTLVVAGLILIILAAAFWIAAYASRPAFNQKLHVGIGQVLAQETATLLSGKGRIVIVTFDPKKFPQLNTQVAAFTAALRKHGNFAIAETMLIAVKENRKAGPGAGLSDSDFVTILEKQSKLDAIVSFIGVPDPEDAKIVALGKQNGPKVVAETKSRRKLKRLFRQQLLHTAIVPRFEFPAPGLNNPSTPREWFDLGYQVVRSNKPPPEE